MSEDIIELKQGRILFNALKKNENSVLFYGADKTTKTLIAETKEVWLREREDLDWFTKGLRIRKRS